MLGHAQILIVIPITLRTVGWRGLGKITGLDVMQSDKLNANNQEISGTQSVETARLLALPQACPHDGMA